MIFWRRQPAEMLKADKGDEYSLTRFGQIALIVILSFAYFLAEDRANETIPAFELDR